MAEGWKQVLEDIRNALRGEPKPRVDDGSGDAAPVAQTESSADAPALAESSPPVPETEAEADVVSTQADADPLTGSGGEPLAQAGGDELQAQAVAGTVTSQEDEALAAEAAPVKKPPTTRWQRLQTIGAAVLILGAIAFAAWPLGLGSLWAQLTAPKPPASDVVATYDGGRITTGDLEAHLKELAPDVLSDTLKSPETLDALVQDVITDELARRWAAEQKTDADKNFQHAMEHITEQMNLDTFGSQLHQGQISVPESEIQAYFEANKNTEFISQTLSMARADIRQRLVERREGTYVRDYITRLKSNASITRDDGLLNVPEPTEADLRDYFDANRASYTVTARYTVDILSAPIITSEVAARATAERALVQLQTGADLTAAAAQISGTQMLTNYVAVSGTQGEDWEAAVAKLQPGESSGVVRGPQAYEIVRLVKSEPERQKTFEEAKAQVEATVRQKKLDDWMAANGAKTLFNIKSRRYTLSQFYDEYKELDPEVRAQYGGSDGLKRLMDAMIERLVLVEDTYDQLLQEKNKAALDQTRLDVLKQMLEQQEVDDKINLTDDDLKKYYDENRDRMALPPKARIRYIRIGLGNSEDEQTAARAKADEAYRTLQPGPFQSGKDFASVAKAYSEDTQTAATGGELPGWIGESGPFESPDLHMLHEMALSVPLNTVSTPLRVGDSLYIIQPIERTEPQTLTLEEAKPYIQEKLRDQKHRELSAQLQERLLKQINLVVYDSVLQSYVASAAR
jgi:parvulin-like peptidyl-prolyl isomerase